MHSYETCRSLQVLMRDRLSVPLFYSYPIEVIARVLGVSHRHARRLKYGQQRPTEPARRLWLAWRDGRLLPPGWADAAFDQRGRLWIGGECFSTPNQILAILTVAMNARHQTEEERSPKAGVSCVLG